MKINLIDVKEVSLHHELEIIAKNLSAPGQQSRLEAEQALRYLSNPAATDLMLSNGNFNAVSNVLEDLSRRHVVLSNDRLKLLLTSSDSFKRSDTIRYLDQVGNASHIPMLQPLIQDQNRGVVKLAISTILDLQNKPAPEQP